MSKIKKVKLVQIAKRNDSAGREFEISHAERLLRMNNPSWELPKKSPFKLTKDGLVKRANSKNTGEPSKQGDDK